MKLFKWLVWITIFFSIISCDELENNTETLSVMDSENDDINKDDNRVTETLKEQFTSTGYILTPVDSEGMIQLSDGKFMMGSHSSDTDALDSEFPQHPVQLSAFWIGEHEVTVAEYRIFIASSGYRQPTYCSGLKSSNENWVSGERENHPMTCISWK